MNGRGGNVCSRTSPSESGPAKIHPSQSFRRWWTARKPTFSTPRRVIFPVVYKLGPRPLVGAARRNLKRYDEWDAENSLQEAENKIRTSSIFRSQTAELFCRCDVVPTSFFRASRSSTTVRRAQRQCDRAGAAAHCRRSHRRLLLLSGSDRRAARATAFSRVIETAELNSVDHRTLDLQRAVPRSVSLCSNLPPRPVWWSTIARARTARAMRQRKPALG